MSVEIKHVGNHVSVIHGPAVTLHLKQGFRGGLVMPTLLPCLPTCLDVESS